MEAKEQKPLSLGDVSNDFIGDDCQTSAVCEDYKSTLD